MISTQFNQFIGGFAGQLAQEYRVARPSYPEALFDWLAEVAPNTDHAWDVGTGTGEAAAPLAKRFCTVSASDSNAEFLDQARQQSNLSYHYWPAESPQLPDQSLDLIVAGMAMHWFDLPVFYDQCRRLLRPNGVLAAFGFYFFEMDDGIGELVHDWYHRQMTGYEFPELVVLRNHYRDFWFPHPPLATPQFTMREDWTFEQLAAFLNQWIVVKRARQAGVEPLPQLLREIKRRWGNDRREIRWPIFLRASATV